MRAARFAAEPVGLFGWVDTGVDTDALAQRMLDEGYLLAPGALFHAERKPSTLMRINFATTQDAAFWKKICKAAHRKWSKHFVGRQRPQRRHDQPQSIFSAGASSFMGSSVASG
jgi:hypothetical protein